ncbi:MAG: response regulator transcription factor [Myxococcota bacterium]
MAQLLVVEDDRRTAELLDALLSGAGHAVERAADGDQALLLARARVFDLVLLDVMLPRRDGFAVCAALRGFSQVPVLMLTARGDPDDRVAGLGLGADDYLAKPFDPRELLARIEAILRRAGPAHRADRLVAGAVALDLRARTATVGGEPVALTTTEFDLLRVLVANAGEVVPRDRIMALARGEAFGAFDRGVDVHVSHLRRKLGDDPRAPRLIKTVHGVGYQLVAEPG